MKYWESCPKCGYSPPKKCTQCDHIFEIKENYRDMWKEELEHDLMMHSQNIIVRLHNVEMLTRLAHDTLP